VSHSSWTVLRVLVAVTMLGWRFVPREWAPLGVDRLRWALGCDDIENLDRLLSRADPERMDQGYYNQLLDTGLDPGLSPPIARAVAELRGIVLRPNLSIVRADGTTWSTNALGMRDRPYAVSRSARTFRMAMTGDSIGVGLGVGDGRGFEPALELWLDEQSRRRGGPAVEILNLAMPGRSPGQRWDHFQKAGWAMDPDLVLFEATAADIGWDQRQLAELLPLGIGWDAAPFGDILKRSGIRPGATAADYTRALFPHRWELLEAAYRAAADDCRARGVPCLFMLIPRVNRAVEPDGQRRLLDLARAAGFTAVVDVSDAFDGLDPAALAIHPIDFHPNAEGHALLAGRLAEALWPLPALEPLRAPSSGATRLAREAIDPDSN
jgi:lysophospholipase L1-like esterase